MALDIIANQDITAATGYIKDGRVVALPTGTSYGYAVDATQGWALVRLQNLKGREPEKTFTVFMSEDLFDKYLDLTAQEKEYLSANKNQPLTLLVKPKESLSHLALDGRVGLRVIDTSTMQQLADSARVPMTATSANRAGQEPCYSAECLQENFGNPIPDEQIDEADDLRGLKGTTYNLSLALILDGGTLDKKDASTIARFTEQGLEVIREGSLKLLPE